MIGKVQNTNTSFGKLVIEKTQKSRIPLAILCTNEDVKKELADSFEKIDKASGDYRVSLYAREYSNDDSISVHLSSVHWQKILPSLKIYNTMGQEDRVEAIKKFTKKALERMSIESLPDISELLNKYS